MTDYREANDFHQAALDKAGRLGFSNAEFEDSEDELPEVLGEFLPEMNNTNEKAMTDAIKPNLKEKLQSKTIESVLLASN